MWSLFNLVVNGCNYKYLYFLAVLFVELWKRKNAELTHYFDCDEYHDEEEHPRAEFARNAPKMRRNVVTGQLEPYFPPAALLFRRVISWIASISFVSVSSCIIHNVISQTSADYRC